MAPSGTPSGRLVGRHNEYAEGVKQRSPGSRSAPWVMTIDKHLRRRRYTTPEDTLFNAFSVSDLFGPLPRVRCATLGSVVQLLRSNSILRSFPQKR